jgi:hypothetical protein
MQKPHAGKNRLAPVGMTTTNSTVTSKLKASRSVWIVKHKSKANPRKPKT